MEKRNYVKPVLSGEEFVPQNYIAACGDENKVYLFKCDAGGGTEGTVYYETNGVAGLQKEGYCSCENVPIFGKHSTSLFCETWTEADYYRTSIFHACAHLENTSGIHEAKTTDEFLSGYYVVGSSVTPVTIWTGANKNNVHCTTALDINSWTTAKS